MRRVLLYLFASLVLAFLFLPSLMVVPMSVTDTVFLRFPPQGFTWTWYEQYFYPLINPDLVAGFSAGHAWWPYKTLISFELAVMVAVLAVPVGALAAYGLSRGRFWGSNFLNAFILSPLIVPAMITAVVLFFFMSDSLPSFLESPAGLSVPVWGEYALIFLAIDLGIVSIGLLLFKTLHRKPMDDWNPKLLLWYDRLRPWAPVMLLLAAAYLLLPWLSSAAVSRGAHRDDIWLFNPRDPYPTVPVVSPGLLLAHVMLALPYVTIVLSAALRNVERTQDRAAAILGAGPIATLTRVVLPQMKPGLVVAALFATLVSFNEVVIALFLSPSNSRLQTLPYEIWERIRIEISPFVAVASTMVLFLTIVLLGAAFFAYRRSDAFLEKRKPNFQGR